MNQEKDQWISVLNRLPTDIENGTCLLVQYLEVFSGVLTPTITRAYYDNPDSYVVKTDAKGWLDWYTETRLLVTHWRQEPEMVKTTFEGVKYTEFIEKYGRYPNLGSIHDDLKPLNP